MLTAEQRFGHSASTPRASSAGQSFQDTPGGARFRLALGVAGLTALVAWGMASEGRSPLADVKDTSGPAVSASEPRYDGHGKWTGYLPY